MQIQLLSARHGQRWDILKFRGVNVAEQPGQIHHRANVRTVKSAASHRRRADRANQVRRWSSRQRGHHGLAVAIVKHQPVGILCQATCLLFDGPVKTLLVDLNLQRLGHLYGSFMQSGWLRV